jgi:hypothetical protein
LRLISSSLIDTTGWAPVVLRGMRLPVSVSSLDAALGAGVAWGLAAALDCGSVVAQPAAPNAPARMAMARIFSMTALLSWLVNPCRQAGSRGRGRKGNFAMSRRPLGH